MLAHTRHIRAIMKDYGRNQIFTNKYTLTRTVKCYVPHEKDEYRALIKALKKYRKEHSLKGVMKIKKNVSTWATRWPAIIVVFPID